MWKVVAADDEGYIREALKKLIISMGVFIAFTMVHNQFMAQRLKGSEMK